jgi:sarcosine oxidase delta subunit
MNSFHNWIIECPFCEYRDTGNEFAIHLSTREVFCPRCDERWEFDLSEGDGE